MVLRMIEDLLNWMIDHWKDLSAQAVITAIAVIVAKRVLVKQVKKVLAKSLPTIFKEEDAAAATLEHVRAQTDIVKGLHEKILQLERRTEESAKYQERTLREIKMNIGNKP